MKKILIVGSGASGVHFALSVLKKNYDVTMLDVGHERPVPVLPEGTFSDLKKNLKDPVEYFLGRNYEGVIFPDSEGEYYGFPPSKTYVFSKPDSFEYSSKGFEPLLSFARGGLAEAWTGGVYPLNEEELSPFPFSFSDMEPFYSEIAARIAVAGARDDLQRFYPVHENLMEPLRLDEHSERLISDYQKQKNYVNGKLKCFLGRSRIAIASQDRDDRKGCTYKGRCLWGCPTESLYTPSITLRECMKHANFRYLSGTYVRYFKFRSGKIESVVVESLDSRTTDEIPTDSLVLAAGTLSSAKIFMESFWQADREVVKLCGLMDNRQILIPFINLGMIGRAYNPDTYQYHQLAIGIETEEPKQYLHGLITTLKTALVHPIIRSIPFDLRSSIALFRNVRAGLGLINLNFPDHRRLENFVTLEPDERSQFSRMSIRYSPPAEEQAMMNRGVKIVKKMLRKLGCIVPPGTIHVRPMGASVHYAGTIPMSVENMRFSSTEFCRSRDFENLHFVDGSTFPVLPSKNLTFALMANAIRVAHHEF